MRRAVDVDFYVCAYVSTVRMAYASEIWDENEMRDTIEKKTQTVSQTKPGATQVGKLVPSTAKISDNSGDRLPMNGLPALDKVFYTEGL